MMICLEILLFFECFRNAVRMANGQLIVSNMNMCRMLFSARRTADADFNISQIKLHVSLT